MIGAMTRCSILLAPSKMVKRRLFCLTLLSRNDKLAAQDWS